MKTFSQYSGRILTAFGLEFDISNPRFAISAYGKRCSLVKLPYGTLRFSDLECKGQQRPFMTDCVQKYSQVPNENLVSG